MQIRIRHLSRAALETIQRATHAFAASTEDMGTSQTPSPSVPRKRRARQRAFTFGPKNKNITATGNLRLDRQICKGKNLPENAK